MTAAAGGPLRVAFFRGIHPHVGASVTLFGDALEAGLRGDPEITVSPVALREAGIGRRLVDDPDGVRLPARLENLADSFVRYPARAAATRIGRPRPDVFHIIDQWYGHLAAALPAARTVVSCQDLTLAKYDGLGADYRPPRLAAARFRVSTAALDRAAMVVCSSTATREDLVRLRGVRPERIAVVPKGLGAHLRPLPEDRAALRASLPVPPGRRVVLHVSTGLPYKNVATTLRVLAALGARGLDVALVRVGVPLSADERGLAAELGVTDRIDELGAVGDARLTEVYNAADVLLFPSLHEGFGRPPLEAMACGLPVVASTAPPFGETLGDAALAAAPLDVAGLTDAVAHVLGSPPAAADLRRRGLERTRRYTWSALVDAYRDVYRQVGGRAPSGAGQPPLY